LAPPEFELEEPVTGGVIPLGEEQVFFGFRVDVGNAPVIDQNLHGLAEAGDASFFLGTRGDCNESNECGGGQSGEEDLSHGGFPSEQ
jgi:hypothetical protein